MDWNGSATIVTRERNRASQSARMDARSSFALRIATKATPSLSAVVIFIILISKSSLGMVCDM